MIGYSSAPRYAELTQRLTGDDELVPPGLILEADRPEYSALKRERLWAFGTQLAAGGAGFRSEVAFCLGAVDRVVVVAGAIVVAGSTLAAIAIRLDDPATFAIQTIATSRDLRGLKGGPGSGAANHLGSLVVRTKNNAAAVGIEANLGFFSSNVVIPINVMLRRNSALIVRETVDNSALSVYVWGSERPGRPEEFTE